MIYYIVKKYTYTYIETLFCVARSLSVMCPNQEVERSLLPDCHISNRVFMYSMLDYLHAGERRSEEVDAQLRDRYEVFCQVLDNFPIPLHPEPEVECDYECVLEALHQRLQQRDLELESLHTEL